MANQELLEAYLDTEIHFQTANSQMALISKKTSESERDLSQSIFSLLGSAQQVLWVVTAFNPYSVRQSDHQNLLDKSRLFEDLTHQDFHIVNSQCRSSSGEWEESSFFFFDLHTKSLESRRSAVIQLAKKYDQNAVFEVTGSALTVLPVVAGLSKASVPYKVRLIENK